MKSMKFWWIKAIATKLAVKAQNCLNEPFASDIGRQQIHTLYYEQIRTDVPMEVDSFSFSSVRSWGFFYLYQLDLKKTRLSWAKKQAITSPISMLDIKRHTLKSWNCRRPCIWINWPHPACSDALLSTWRAKTEKSINRNLQWLVFS